jgi:hypothetical protein
MSRMNSEKITGGAARGVASAAADRVPRADHTGDKTANPGEERASPPTAIVVGAGVSGCACAAALAAAGVRVTVMNSAMDRVGLPAYGPDMVSPDGTWTYLDEVLASLPPRLRSVWIGASVRPAGGEAVLNVDRRSVSVETKRVLERLAGLEFRQGFVVDIRVGAPGPTASAHRTQSGRAGRGPAPDSAERVQVETIFGEIFEADAVVIAVGLSLGGRAVVGEAAVEGGRYGEPASDGLLAALEALGAELRDVSLEVGPRVPARFGLETLEEAGAGMETGLVTWEGRREALAPASQAGPLDPWPLEFPPAAHMSRELRGGTMVLRDGTMVRRGERTDAGSERGGRPIPMLSPDGAATAETYLNPCGLRAPDVTEGWRTCVRETHGELEVSLNVIASRMPVSIAAKALSDLSADGRACLGSSARPVWVVGRAAGAESYAESLFTGVRAAAEIARFLGGMAANDQATLGAHSPERGGEGPFGGSDGLTS